MGVAASLIRELRPGLTSEEVRAAMTAVAEEHGCELPDDVIVSHGAQSAIGHESGYGEIPAGEPVIVDIWPRDRASRCYADMTRTFVAGGGEPPQELAEFWKWTKDSLDRVYAEIRAGVNGRALFETLRAALHRGRPADAADQDAGRDPRGRLLPLARPRRGPGGPRAAVPRAGLSDELVVGRRRDAGAGLLPAAVSAAAGSRISSS